MLICFLLERFVVTPYESDVISVQDCHVLRIPKTKDPHVNTFDALKRIEKSIWSTVLSPSISGADLYPLLTPMTTNHYQQHCLADSSDILC